MRIAVKLAHLRPIDFWSNYKLNIEHNADRGMQITYIMLKIRVLPVKNGFRLHYFVNFLQSIRIKDSIGLAVSWFGRG